jgi:GT2 family glycosyltransferase
VFCGFEAKNEVEKASHIEECKKSLPLISIIIPSRKGEEIQSRASLEAQSYPNLEIIVAYDTRKQGANVTRNRGAKKAKGEFILFSDNDLEWKPDAIAHLYRTLLKHPNKAYSYGSYTIDGKLVGHKEFSSHDLWKWNYISTMSLIRRKDFELSGGFDESVKRFQDWDLWLTLLDKGKEGVFCGECLFSTKLREGITYGKGAMDPSMAREIVLKKHSIQNKKLADIIIPHQNRHDMLKNCLDRLSHDQFNIIVVTGGTFAENCNKGARIAETDNLIFMNDDIEPTTEVIMGLLESPADICGAAQITPNWHQSKVWYGISYQWNGSVINESITENLSKVTIPTGFLLRFKRKVWEELGGFDEEYKNGGEDQEIGLQALEKGYTVDIVKIPTIHHHSSSRDRFKHTSDNRTRLMQRWPEERVRKIIEKHKKQLLFL